ncbi:MAG: sulfotransferase [Okeania sp. SIO3B5]|uniref:sulfotransferase domain-containing protein n=1 Tax=Okeania sp. SIO3B5 TaxID=2607811 RepID=UPI0013FE63F3|nr:sulfotransferase domain-containing protein [Okeania sp. SIO3B5]NEO53876.1 sulfotransferase [Okeania sp. SIO3B5]
MKRLIKTSYQQLLERYKISKLAIASLSEGLINRNLFHNVEKYCMFIGYPRSGHSLLGGLIDAHPNIILGNELDALKYIEAGFRGLQIYYLLLKSSQYFINQEKNLIPEAEIPKGRFKYIVPNQYNGKFTNLKIIGDKRGGGSTKRLKDNFEILSALESQIKVPIKIIHVVRNPFDNISSIYKKCISKSLEWSIDYYFNFCYANESIIKKIDSDQIFLLKLESLIAEPKKNLKEITQSFLGVEVDDNYLKDCSSIVFDSPNKSRNKSPWNEQLIELTQRKINKVSFLQGYNYDN